MATKSIHFKSACIKTLSYVETIKGTSNQHEFNGVSQLKTLLGNDKREEIIIFSIRGHSKIFHSSITWYDARLQHETRSEYRLYFQSNPVMNIAKEGDTIIIGFDTNNQLYCELIPQEVNNNLSSNTWEIYK